MISILKQLRLFIEFLLVYLLFLIFSIIPINLVSIIGGNIFKIFGPFSKSHKIACKNYKIIFKNLNDNEINKKIYKSWENLGRTIFELSILNKLVNKKNNKIKINGLENIKDIIHNKEKVIFFSIHQSNWEILVPVLDQLHINVTAIYRHINNKLINDLVLKKRNSSISLSNSFYTPKGKESARDIINSLNKDSSMILLVDQKDSAGEMVKFFEINTKTQMGFIKIAKKYNLKLVPIKNARININNFEITFCNPISINDNDNDKDIMLNINQIIESWIIENPTQWFWQHNRFN